MREPAPLSARPDGAHPPRPNCRLQHRELARRSDLVGVEARRQALSAPSSCAGDAPPSPPPTAPSIELAAADPVAAGDGQRRLPARRRRRRRDPDGARGHHSPGGERELARGALRPLIDRELIAPAARIGPDIREIEAIFAALGRESRDPGPGAAAMNALYLGLILAHLWRACGLSGSADSLVAGAPIAERFRQLVELHYRDNLSVDDYARDLGVTRGPASRRLRARAGSCAPQARARAADGRGEAPIAGNRPAGRADRLRPRVSRSLLLQSLLSPVVRPVARRLPKGRAHRPAARGVVVRGVALMKAVLSFAVSSPDL